jgi:alpha-galactosidase
MITLQGTIHKLVIEAYTEQSRNKLLQAVLLDPTVSNYHNAVCMINDLCELQKDILPPLHW